MPPSTQEEHGWWDAEEQEAAKAAKRELLTYCGQLEPQHLQVIQALYAQGGPEAVCQQFAMAGLSSGAVQLLAHNLVSKGLEGTAAAVRYETFQQHAEATTAKAIERASPAKTDSREFSQQKRDSWLAQALRDPKMHKDATRLYTENGWRPRQGLSPLEDLITNLSLLEDKHGSLVANAYRQLGDKKMSAEEQLAAVAKMVNLPTETVDNLSGAIKGLRLQDGFTQRAAKRDARNVERRAAPSQARREEILSVIRHKQEPSGRERERASDRSRRASLENGLKAMKGNEPRRESRTETRVANVPPRTRSQPESEPQETAPAESEPTRREALAAAIEMHGGADASDSRAATS